MRNFLINVIVQFLASSACVEHHVFIIRQTICTCRFISYVFHTESYITPYYKFIMNNVPYKNARTNCLPDDKHLMFEICSRPQELNENINCKVSIMFMLHTKHSYFI
jgi:hypothetical protein